MERVIMLKWFKKITDRLFGDEIEEEIEAVETESTQQHTQDQETKRERPTFRFPMITDAEIYGWDDDDEEMMERTERTELSDLAENFEPTPLYQNERWPEEQRGKIHRVHSSIHDREPQPVERTEKNQALKTELEGIQKKIRTERFTPSKVPSPIYGYKMPEPKKEEMVQPIVKNDVDMFKAPKEKDRLTEETFEENVLADPLPLMEEAVEEVAVTAEPELLEELIEAIEAPKEPEEVEVIEEMEAPESAEEIVEEPSALAETLQEEVVQERVIPFNVLMLKSDKKKLKAVEIANEMKRKVKKDVEPVKAEQPKTLPNETIAVPETTEVAVVDNHEASADENVETSALEHYKLPTMDYLIPPESQIEDTEWLAAQSEKLEESLSHFGVEATVINAVQGPTVTRFELTVGQGTKVSRVRNLADDLKLTLAARDIRIQAPIPGESAIGIEIPNRTSRAVRISEVIETEVFQNSTSPLEAVLGLGLTGEPETIDLRKMPHGLIAGATGSGKSVCINSILVSLLYKALPADLKMMLIDPKMVELAPFNGIPHLISPVITDVKAATAALKWAVSEMERRYELLAHAGVRDIDRYNEKAVENRQFSLKMPYLLIVIDELADLMMMAPADVEVSISRIAQKARACGIHLIIATQRPSVDVITGIIKANIPTRIAFSVSSQVDSRTMIDTNGAERLLGRGDMLYVGNGESAPVRLQGTFVTDGEIERIIEHVQHEASPTYLFGQDELLKSAVEDDEDPLFVDACTFIFEQDSASTSMLQRHFSIGYNRAAKLMDRFEKLKFISPQQGSRARDVYLTTEQLNELKETIL